MPKVASNGIEIEYESFGDPAADPILLVMGLGGQLIHWDVSFCERLAGLGHRVVRFDNRDVGLSTWFDEAGTPDLTALLAPGSTARPPYSLGDMADDAAGLLDALEIDRVHAVGVSLGGMIVQRLAIGHPERLKSLTSVMSTTGSPKIPAAAPHVMAKLLEPPPRDLEDSVARALAMSKLVGSPAYPTPEADVRARAVLAFERAAHPQGAGRQLAAIFSDGDRSAALGEVQTPALVIHGRDDALVPFAAGEATAEALPGARTLWVDGMGHDLPVALHETITNAIHQHAAANA